MADGVEDHNNMGNVENLEFSEINSKPKLVKNKLVVKKGINKESKIIKSKGEKVHKVEAKSDLISSKSSAETGTEKSVFSGGIVLVLAVLVGLLFYNQIQLFELSTLAGIPAQVSLSNVLPGKGLSLSENDKVSYGPALLATGEQPAIPGYKTKMKEFPTISANPKKPKTGDVVQDTLNKIVPTGTPEYGQEIGVSFDDPINSLPRLDQLEDKITLTPDQQKRWQRIVGSFTCDYCCGSPQEPTIITNCGCAHAASWRGIAKFLISKYGNTVSDEQIMGEMTKWKALFYPGPTVQRFIQEEGAGGNAGGQVKLDQLPQMVGGC